jgi:hypothetical protein
MNSLKESETQTHSHHLDVLYLELSANITDLIRTYQAVASNLSKSGCLDGSPIKSMLPHLSHISDLFLQASQAQILKHTSENSTVATQATGYRWLSPTERRKPRSTNLLKSIAAAGPKASHPLVD